MLHQGAVGDGATGLAVDLELGRWRRLETMRSVLVEEAGATSTDDGGTSTTDQRRRNP